MKISMLQCKSIDRHKRAYKSDIATLQSRYFGAEVNKHLDISSSSPGLLRTISYTDFVLVRK